MRAAQVCAAGAIVMSGASVTSFLLIAVRAKQF
jgi:hypothetical protein